MAVKKAILDETATTSSYAPDSADVYVVHVGLSVFEMTADEARACWDARPADLRSGAGDASFILWSLDLLGCRVAPALFQRRHRGQASEEGAVVAPELLPSNERGASLFAPLNPERLRAERRRLRMSQSQFAEAVRNAGSKLGEPNACSKRFVQKWEAGVQTRISESYQRSLADVIGLAYEVLRDPAVRADFGVEVASLGEVVLNLTHLTEDVIDVRTWVDPSSTAQQVREAYLRHVPVPRLNGARLREARVDAGYSQAGLALELRTAGEQLEVPNGCTKRLVQKWEKGEHGLPHPVYQVALQAVFRVPFEELCAPALVPTHEHIVTALTRIALDIDACRTRLVRLHARLDYGY